jgi:hypothetical protein
MVHDEKHETGLKMAQVIEKEIKSFVFNSPLNRMPDDENLPIFDEPLVKFADGNDDLFNQFKSIIAPTHLTPREALVAIFHKNPDYIGKSISVISWILPITLKTRKSNREQKMAPSKLWANTRWYGEKFNDALRDYVANNLKVRGYMAVAPTKLPSLNTPDMALSVFPMASLQKKELLIAVAVWLLTWNYLLASGLPPVHTQIVCTT